jgi:hypothetical protein
VILLSTLLLLVAVVEVLEQVEVVEQAVSEQTFLVIH